MCLRQPAGAGRETMILDLSRLRTGDLRIDRSYEPAAFTIDPDDFRLTAPVTFAADLHKDATKVRLVGKVETTLECACSRCLEPFEVPVAEKFDLLFLPASEYAPSEDHEVRDADVGATFYTDDRIDLGDVMREQFYLVLPMKGLCRVDCKGLCSECGVNRNRETCTCQTTWIDPRMEALRRLTERQ
jgi:uncharacterized protein